MKLAYEMWGSGPRTLVALHGFTGNRGVWRRLERCWAKELKVVAVDLPGHGESEPAGTLGFPGAVDAIAQLISELGLESPTVLGYSLGARVALALAAAHPESVEKLILESGSPGLDSARERQARKKDDEALAESLERIGLEAFVDRWEQLPLFAGLRKLPAAVQSELRARRLACRADGLADSLRTMGVAVQPNLWPVLPRVRVPTLLLTGADDVKFTGLARRMAASLPICWRRTFTGVGHTLHLEIPDAYAAEVAAFATAPWQQDAEFDVEERTA